MIDHRLGGLVLGLSFCVAACGTSEAESTSGCTLIENTSQTATVNTAGCHVLSRDTSACDDARRTAGFSGYWLKFSCRVSLKMQGNTVQAESDNRPDYKSFYFPKSDACYETQSGVQNPNQIAVQKLNVSFPLSPDSTSQQMRGAIVGLSLNGVGIFGNFAAPGDDIFNEAMTFDSCGAHPQNSGVYHYHGEPYAISNNDSNFIGVMRDGYPIYGRKDPDGSMPTLDTAGGHTGVTVDSPTTPIYHYHVNQQTSTGAQTAGQKQWFLTTGMYHGTPAACTGC